MPKKNEELDALSAKLEEMAMAVPEEQELTASEERLLNTIYERLDLFERSNRKFHDEAKDCREILHMRDPDQDGPRTIAENRKETLQLQTLKSTINNVVADQMLSMPEAKLLPETADMQDAADDLQDMVHYVVYCANDYENIHYRLCEDFYGTGTMVQQNAWDPDAFYGKGEIALIRWPIEAFLWDPAADNIQDCRAVMKVSWHPLSWYVAHYPEKAQFVGSESGEHNDVGRSTAQADVDDQEDEGRALLIEYWWREYNASTRRYTINVAYAAGNALLEVHKNVYNHGLYPFSILPHDYVEGSIAGEGLVKELAPMMRYINRYAAYADMNARMSSKGRMLVQRGSGIDKEALTDWTNDVIEGDRITQGDAWNWMQNQPFNSTITNLMTMFQSDLKADSGANQFTRGETTGGIVSGKAINSLIQAGGKVASMRTEQIKYFFKDMVEQIIWLMSQFYDDDRVMMITGRKGRRSLNVDTQKLFGKKSRSAVNPPPYTVQIEVSSRDPQRIANQNQMFMEAFTMAAQTNNPMRLSDLFRMLNLDGKDKILPVIEANEHYQEQMQQMQQQLQQMGEQMQQMQQENVDLKKELTDTTNDMANMAAGVGAGAVPQPGQTQAGAAGGGPETTSAVVANARNTLGQPTGSELPT
jgi:hypothetical protein